MFSMGSRLCFSFSMKSRIIWPQPFLGMSSDSKDHVRRGTLCRFLLALDLKLWSAHWVESPVIAPAGTWPHCLFQPIDIWVSEWQWLQFQTPGPATVLCWQGLSVSVMQGDIRLYQWVVKRQMLRVAAPFVMSYSPAWDTRIRMLCLQGCCLHISETSLLQL